MTDSPDNRPRANAIAALARIDRADAAARLQAMLMDPRPLHRLSALWAAEAMALTQCATRVADLAKCDVSRPVRNRARRTARRLLAAMTAHRATPVIERAAPQAIDVESLEMTSQSVSQPPRAKSTLSRLLIVPLLPATLAQSSTRLSEISRSFVDRGSNWSWLDWNWLVPAMAATGVIAATLFALRWSINDARRHGPAYRTMATSLKLSRREQRLLNAVAARCGHINATGLLLSRGTFDHSVHRWREHASRARASQVETLTAMRGRLFG